MPLSPQNIEPTFPRVNGHELSRTSVDLKIDALPIVGWTALNFKWSRAPGKSYASNSKPQARTRGKITFTSDLTVYETTWGVIFNYLRTKGQALNLGPSQVDVLITLTYFEPSQFAGTKLIELVGANIIEAEEAISDSDDVLVRKLTLDLMDLLEDGASPIIENGVPGF